MKNIPRIEASRKYLERHVSLTKYRLSSVFLDLIRSTRPRYDAFTIFISNYRRYQTIQPHRRQILNTFVFRDSVESYVKLYGYYRHIIFPRHDCYNFLPPRIYLSLFHLPSTNLKERENKSIPVRQ